MAASVFMPIAITAAIVNLASGVLVDRIPVRVLLALALILEGGTLLIAPFLYTISLAIAFGLMMGIKGGIQATVSSVAWAQYFGRLHLGSISGTVTTILVASSAFGPMLFGVARDMLGSYTLVLVISALLPVLLAVANLLYAKPPVKEAQ
jgi:MFS family permease